jgi:hypothetical protein
VAGLPSCVVGASVGRQVVSDPVELRGECGPHALLRHRQASREPFDHMRTWQRPALPRMLGQDHRALQRSRVEL